MKKIKDPKLYFYVSNGIIIKSLKELPSALAKMPQDVYNYHVNPAKNDFANWVRDVFEMPKLALEIQKVKREEMINMVKEALKIRPESKATGKKKVKLGVNKNIDSKKIRGIFEKKLRDIWLS